MITLRIEHGVPDYGRWKQAFDRDPADRRGSGVRRWRVSRSVDDPNHVLIDLDFDTLAEAEGLLRKMRLIWEGDGRGVMTNPRALIFEAAESGDLGPAGSPASPGATPL